mgnify:CR=1 FL=1
MENTILSALSARKSVRVFTDEAVTADERAAILHAAFQAPTAGNQQLYTILNITDPALKATLADLCDHQPFIAKAPLVLVFMANFGHPITRTFVGRYAATYDELTGGSLALVVRSRADRLARSVGPDTLPYPLLCDADGVLYDLLDIPTRSGALSTYSLEAWQIMRDAKRRGYHSPANGQQQLPLTLVLDKDGTVLFSHYGASLTDVPADCGAAQSLLEDLDVAKPVDVDDADVTIYADPGAAPDIPGLTPHVHEYAQPNLGETGVFSVFDDAYKDEE